MKKHKKTNIVILICMATLIALITILFVCTYVNCVYSTIKIVSDTLASKIIKEKKAFTEFTTKDHNAIEKALYEKYHERFKVKGILKRVNDSTDSETGWSNYDVYRVCLQKDKNLNFSVKVNWSKDNEFVDDYKLAKKIYSISKTKDKLVSKYSTRMEKYINHHLSTLGNSCYARVFPKFKAEAIYIDRHTLNRLKNFKDNKGYTFDSEAYYGIAHEISKNNNIIKIDYYTENTQPTEYKICVALYNNQAVSSAKLYKQIQNIVSNKYTIEERASNYNQNIFTIKKPYPFDIEGCIYKNKKNYNSQTEEIGDISKDANTTIDTIWLSTLTDNQPDQTFEISADKNGKLNKDKNNLIKDHNYIKD